MINKISGSASSLLRNTRVQTCIFTILLIVFSWKFLIGLSEELPLDFWDENFYLWMAISNTMRADWGYFYSCFYKLALRLNEVPYHAYYWNSALQTTLLGLSALVLFRRLGVSPMAAFIGGLWILLLKFNVLAPVKIDLFCVTAYLCILATASFIPRASIAAYFVAVATLLCMFIRQGSIIISFGILIYAVVLFWKEEKDRVKNIAIAVGFYIAILDSSVMHLGSPFSHGRGWFAFADHVFFSNRARFIALHGTEVKKEIVQLVFPGADSIVEAMFANPGEFFRHITKQVFNFIYRFFPAAFSHFPMTKFGEWFPKLETPIFGSVLILFAYLNSRLPSKNFSFSVSPFQRLALIFGTLAVVKAITISALLSPAPRYFTSAVVVLVCLCAILADRLILRKVGAGVSIAFAALLVIFSSNIKTSIPPAKKAVDVSKPAIEFLRKHPHPSPVFYSLRPYPMYSQTSTDWKVNWDVTGLMGTELTKDSIGRLLQDSTVTVAVFDWAIREYLTVNGLRDAVELFENQPGKFGYKRVFEKNGTNVYFRDNLFEK